MHYKSKKIQHIILFISAALFSRAMLMLFDDPEGPNLLIVMVAAVIVYSLSSAAYLLSISACKKLLLAILIQTVLVTGGYFCLRNNPVTVTTEDAAVTMVKKAYPLYADYPSDNLPIKRVEVMDTPLGFRVGMYIEGSGLPGILQANCFLVSRTGEVAETGFFHGEGPAKSINLSTCTPKE